MNGKKVPVQQTSLREIDIEIAKAAYKVYARRYGTDQSFGLTMRRGGFCWAEIAHFLYGQIQHLEQEIREIEQQRLAK
ncbi:TPA: hypothetical protein M5802_002534 [Morganella morganii]|uniref:hypothetical protein n=1 Tax=Morganella morganii TaxID=582 RepID=UPI00388EEC7B|nr:hypothetical protein [Morganella morganii]